MKKEQRKHSKLSWRHLQITNSTSHSLKNPKKKEKEKSEKRKIFPQNKEHTVP